MVRHGGIDRREDLGSVLAEEICATQDLDHSDVRSSEAHPVTPRSQIVEQVRQMIDRSGVDRADALHVQHDGGLLTGVGLDRPSDPISVVLAIGEEERTVEAVHQQAG